MQLNITIPNRLISLFSNCLQEGFKTEVRLGVSVFELITEQWEFSADWMEKNIQTVFLNHQPVDDFNNTMVNQNDCLALSAAMPGLMGAIMRRGGYLSQMRRQITYSPHEIRTQKKQGTIQVKLFNLLIQSMGPYFLQKGIEVSSMPLMVILENIFRLPQGKHAILMLDQQKIEPALVIDKINQTSCVQVQCRLNE